ncbi:MAG: hypothetical protein ACK42Y_09145 [Candidatus Thermochlorobacter sp.]
MASKCIVALLVLTHFVFLQKQEAPFRNISWGMPPSTVLAVERATLIKDGGNRLFYKAEEEGYPIILVYTFIENQLVQATCIFQYEGQVSTSDILKDLEGKVSKKFGSPEIVKTNYKAVWVHSGTSISLTLTDEQKVVLNYVSNHHAKQFADKWKSSL